LALLEALVTDNIFYVLGRSYKAGYAERDPGGFGENGNFSSRIALLHVDAEYYHEKAGCNDPAKGSEEAKNWARGQYLSYYIRGVGSRQGRSVFQAINVNESYCNNKIFPPKERMFNRLEKTIIRLSDGRLSIEDIRHALLQKFGRTYKSEFMRIKCMGFFLEVFFNNWGLGIAKPWSLFFNKEANKLPKGFE
jgi:hypothetical protein